jgi:hypothetical protein
VAAHILLKTLPPKKFFFAILPSGKTNNEKNMARQTSINTHPVHATEASTKRDKIIATLYTVSRLLATPPSFRTVRK